MWFSRIGFWHGSVLCRLAAMKRELKVKELQLLDATKRRFLKHQQDLRASQVQRLDQEISTKVTWGDAFKVVFHIKEPMLETQALLITVHPAGGIVCMYSKETSFWALTDPSTTHMLCYRWISGSEKRLQQSRIWKSDRWSWRPSGNDSNRWPRFKRLEMKLLFTRLTPCLLINFSLPPSSIRVSIYPPVMSHLKLVNMLQLKILKAYVVLSHGTFNRAHVWHQSQVSL